MGLDSVMVIVLPLNARGRGFDSRQGRQTFLSHFHFLHPLLYLSLELVIPTNTKILVQVIMQDMDNHKTLECEKLV